jgi:hypothetical protein
MSNEFKHGMIWWNVGGILLECLCFQRRSINPMTAARPTGSAA